MYWRDYDLTYQRDDLTWAAHQLYIENLAPSLSFSVSMEADFKLTTSITPVIINPTIIFYLYDDQVLSVKIQPGQKTISVFGAEDLSVTILNDALSAELQDTIVKLLTSSAWETRDVYVKQSDGSWAVKPVYMKQIDESIWM